jgi:hypothetical protein
MRSKWEVQLITTVVAVSAVLYGYVAPVRAAQVTYNLENAELANGWSVTGSIEYEPSGGIIDGGSVSVIEGGGEAVVIDNYEGPGKPYEVILEDNDDSLVMQLETGTEGGVYPLTGNAGESAPIIVYSYIGTGDGIVLFVSGYVTDGPSVPEPSSIMATVTAVTIGVGLRRMKRKV